MSRTISSPRIKSINDIAESMLMQANIRHPSVPVDKIAKIAGVEIQHVDLGDEVSGMLVIDGKNAVIALNPKQGDERKRFTVAHELGHFLLHREQNNSVFVDRDFIVKYRSNKVYSEIELRQEQEANAFAAAILMPEIMIMEALSTKRFQEMQENELITEMARLFKVSIAAMTYRLANLNVLF